MPFDHLDRLDRLYEELLARVRAKPATETQRVYRGPTGGAPRARKQRTPDPVYCDEKNAEWRSMPKGERLAYLTQKLAEDAAERAQKHAKRRALFRAASARHRAKQKANVQKTVDCQA